MKLLSTTILASAAIAFAGAAQANPWSHSWNGVIDNVQINLGDVEAELNVTSEISHHYGPHTVTSFTLSAAAIGNNLAIEIDNAEVLNKIRNRQYNEGDATATLTLGDRDVAFSAAEEIDKLDVTVAAIGNSMTVDADGWHFAKIDNRQRNEAEYVSADAFITSLDTEKLTATVAAIGNNANIEADETTFREVTSKQKNFAEIEAVAAITQDGDLHHDYQRSRGLDVTVAAMGNNLSVKTDNVTRRTLRGGDVTSRQINDANSVSADLKLRASHIDVVAAVAAMGNNLNVELQDRLSQDITSFQENRANVKATGRVRIFDNENKSIEVTVAAIGNNANIEVNADRRSHNSYGDVLNTQLNFGRRVTSNLNIVSKGGADSISATSAAMGNSATIALSGDFFSNIDSVQVNKADVKATMTARIEDATDVAVDLTAAAIGNNLSINISN